MPSACLFTWRPPAAPPPSPPEKDFFLRNPVSPPARRSEPPGFPAPAGGAAQPQGGGRPPASGEETRLPFQREGGPGGGAPQGTLEVRELGLIPYARAFALQQDLVTRRQAGALGDVLLLLEHPPVFTLGRRGSLADVYAPPGVLQREGITVESSNRGGLVTYHGPGQLVGYPIVSLRERHLRTPEYVDALTRALIAALRQIGVDAWCDPDHVGVWTDAGKIAAIGVAQRRGVTMHGFAVNLQPNLAHFGLINPCGLETRGVTSAEGLLGHPVPLERFTPLLVEALRVALGYADTRPADEAPRLQ